MIRISYTQFLNFAVKSGMTRISAIKEIKKQQEDYSPAKDFWKQLRDCIKKIHNQNLDISELDKLLELVPDRKKSAYQKAINKYKGFVKGKNIEWFDPPKSRYQVGEMVVNVNHELGLTINGQPYIVKLLLSEKSSKYALKKNLQTTLGLSYLATEFDQLPEGCKSMVFDIQKGNMHESHYPSSEVIALLQGELLFFETVYKSI